MSNIYRKNAFKRILLGVEEFAKGTASDAAEEATGVLKLPLRRALATFDETIDFSLEATVPDPIPFEKKLRDLLEDHHDFIISEEQHEVRMFVVLAWWIVSSFVLLRTALASS